MAATGPRKKSVNTNKEEFELELTNRILELLSEKEIVETNIDLTDVNQEDLQAALDRLGSRLYVTYDREDREVLHPTDEGKYIITQGSHEYRVWNVVQKFGRLEISELPKMVGLQSARIGQGNAFKNQWISKDGTHLVPAAEKVEDIIQKALKCVEETGSFTDGSVVTELKKRKLVTTSKVILFRIRKGSKYRPTYLVEQADLTAEMLANGTWRKASFKPYNFKSLGTPINSGALHPLQKVRGEFRKLLFNQGFVEMPSNRFIDSGFWNFDALFVPQQHPARDMQDTFYISEPSKADKPCKDDKTDQIMDKMEQPWRMLYTTSEKLPRHNSDNYLRDYTAYWNNVREVHENGGSFNSFGYGYSWSEDESLKLVLRTHTTAVSVWCLNRLSENPRPARYFSIDRVFRNESVDATHLAEFHQVEGVIADYGLSLGGLMKFLEQFFRQLGIHNLKYKPAYNPYTEPSMEIFGYHQQLKKWVEIGNSGMFRPEMLLPAGLPKDLRVYGFGLSLERPTMIRYGLSNIRELLGHKIDLASVETSPAVRFHS